MAWMLQPHNWNQTIRPNLYNVAYGRTIGYKGMGRVGAVYSHLPMGIRGLGQDVTDLPLTNPTYTAQNFPTVEAATYGSGGAGTYTAPTTNWTPYLIAGGVLLVLLLAGGRR